VIRRRSLRFYLDQLGFRLLVDQTFEHGGRWIRGWAPDGSANIALAQASPDSDVSKLIGRDSQIYFITEDVTPNSRSGVAAESAFSFHLRCRPGAEYSHALKMLDGNSVWAGGF